MRYKIYTSFLLLIVTGSLSAQQPEPKHVRIVDTLTAQEKAGRNPVILRSELDSLIAKYNLNHIQQEVKQPVKEATNNSSLYIMAGLFAIIALLGFIIFMIYRYQQKIGRTMVAINKESERSSGSVAGKEKTGKGKMTMLSLENRINDLNAELHKLSKENEGLNRVVKEYNGIQHEYD